MSQETERYQLENNGNTYLVRTTAGGGGGTEVEANPEGTATEDLTKLKVDDTIYGIPEGTEVVANPTLAGTENVLTGLQVGDTKYAVESGMTNPMTDANDLIIGGMNGAPTRLAAGSGSVDYYSILARTNSSPVWVRNGVDILSSGFSNSQYKVPYAINNTSNSPIQFGKPASDFGLGTRTTAPTADNTDGIKIVVLSSEPTTRYNGYLYIITA